MDKDKYDDYKKYINQLENEYRTTFEKVEVYINGSTKLNFLKKNDCLLQILDTFLSSQEEGKPVKEITGVDQKKYCDDMIYGESIYIYKVSRICFILLGAFFYVSFMHFIIGIFDAIDLKDSNVIFQPMYFGIGEILLIIGYICIPKVVSLITGNYFEKSLRYKRIKTCTYYVVLLLTLAIYIFAKELSKQFVIVIPFSNIVLILIYLTLISLVIFFLVKIFDDENSEDKRREREHKYFEVLNKKYDKYVLKCQRRSKDPLDWDKFKRKRAKDNSLLIIVFSAYSIIFLVLAILLGGLMLVKGKGNVDIVGIIMLIGISFLDVVKVLAVREGIRMNKQLSQIESLQ